MAYKRIKKVLCFLRIRKGNVQVALQYDGDMKRLPSFYVEENQPIYSHQNKLYQTEDGTDYILWFYITEDLKHGFHVPKRYTWTNIRTLFSEDMTDVELKDCIMIYKIILDKYEEFVADNQAESKKEVFEAFKKIMYEHCKREYISKIQWYLDGNVPFIFDAVYIPMKKELLEKELKTLAHFSPTPSTHSVFGEETAQNMPSEFHYNHFIKYEEFGGGIESLRWIFVRPTPEAEK